MDLLDKLDYKLVVPVALAVPDLRPVCVALPLVVDHELVLVVVLLGQRQEGVVWEVCVWLAGKGGGGTVFRVLALGSAKESS